MFNWISLIGSINGSTIQDIWKKYGIVLFIISCGVISYLVLTPKEVQIIKTEHTKTVYDRTEAAKWELRYNNAQTIISQFSSNENYIIDEKYDPITGKLISRRIEKKTTTNSTTNSNTVVSSTTSSNTTSTTHSSSSTDTTTIQVTEKTRHWSTIIAYNYFWNEITVGQGFNLGKNITIGGMLQYRADNDISDQRRTSLGLFGIFRY